MAADDGVQVQHLKEERRRRRAPWLAGPVVLLLALGIVLALRAPGSGTGTSAEPAAPSPPAAETTPAPEPTANAETTDDVQEPVMSLAAGEDRGVLGDLPSLWPKEIDDTWVYEHELLGVLSAESLEDAVAMQRGKLASLPPAHGVPILDCEGIWYLLAYRDILDAGYAVPAERRQALLLAARATFEVLLEKDPGNVAALQGMVAFCSEQHDPRTALVFAERLMKQADETNSEHLKVSSRLALARLTRQLRQGDSEMRAAAYLTESLNGMPLSDAVRREIEAEMHDGTRSMAKAGVGLFGMPGLSSVPPVTGTGGSLRRLMPQKRDRILRALSETRKPSYSPGWTMEASGAMDPSALMVNLMTTAGFASDTHVRLYYAALVLQEAPNDPLALTAMGQSMQEAGLQDLADGYFNRATASCAQMDPRVSGRLGAYISFRQGFTAMAKQDPLRARQAWEAARGSPELGDFPDWCLRTYCQNAGAVATP